MIRAKLVWLAAALAATGLAHAHGFNHKPDFIVGDAARKHYDGVSDDLLTGGLGKTGLQLPAAAPHPCTIPFPSTPERLRTCAIYNNYRALADMTTAGGYGVLYGPNIDLDGGNTLGEGLIAGTEWIAYAGSPSGRDNVVLMVQVPDSFDRKRPCIVTASSSGSRGVYGAVGTTGEWALKRGCAVAYTDKGTGNGVHDLQNDTVNLIDGTRTTADDAGKRSHFTARLSDAQRDAFNTATPNRFAIKHAHSQRNPEANWGKHTLWAVEFAFFVLNEQYGRHGGKHKQRRIVPENTIVIASSVSNGGGAAIAAAEEDRHRQIDAVVVSEPQIQLPRHPHITVLRGGVAVAGGQRPLLDYTSWANIYQPCAALAPENAASPFLFALNAARAANRCQALADKGLVAGGTAGERGTDALEKLKAHGWEADSNLLHASHYAFFVAPAGATTYVNAHGRFSVRRNLCGYSYGATGATGAPTPLAAAALDAIFSTGNGVPPNSGINLINNLNPGGPLKDDFSKSPSSGIEDFNLDGALCIRDLATGRDTVSGRRLHGAEEERSERVREGIRATFRDGNLHGKPAIIVHGRNDALVPVNHTSRPYLGLNRLVEGQRTRLRYYEVTNAQHFEAFLPIAGYDTRFIPLHVYGIQALNLMYAHLTTGAPLPPSQVVHTTPRPGPSPAAQITAANVPPISSAPDAANRIVVGPGHVSVPN
jgi:hydroxybutyrate-dimer hydrolase